jgi:hypothetical protein
MDPPVYAIVALDQQAIHFRCAEPHDANPDKYRKELLNAYLFVEDDDALYGEYAAQGVKFTRGTCKHAMALARVRGEDCDAVCWLSVRPYSLLPLFLPSFEELLLEIESAVDPRHLHGDQ